MPEFEATMRDIKVTWYLKNEDGTLTKLEEDPERYEEIKIKGKMEEIEPEPSDET